MFCMKCGQELHDNSAFCVKCGSPVAQPANQLNSNQEKPNQGVPIGPGVGQPYGSGFDTSGYSPQRTINSPGKVLLIVVGILLMIGGVQKVVVLLDNAKYLQYIRILGDEYLILYVIKIACAACLLLSGIRGLLYCGRPEKGKVSVSNGFSIVILQVLDWIAVSMMTRGLIDSFSGEDIVFGIILPILLAIGGSMNNKATQNDGGI